MDPFATLGAPRRFDLDLTALEKTHRELSRALHPDKFTQAGAWRESEGSGTVHTVNEVPQPQEAFSFGFTNLKPCRISVFSQSNVAPFK